MTRTLFAALLLASAAPGLGQQSISTLPPPVVADPKVAALRDAALKDDYAWDIVEGLTTEVGQRLAATEAEARARDWAIKRLTAMGFSNVHVEPFEMPVWTRGAEAAEIVSPFPQKLIIAALPVAGSTLTTISVSVSAWVRISLESMPTKRILILDWAVAGVDTGVATGSVSTLSELRGAGVMPASAPVVKIFEPAW